MLMLAEELRWQGDARCRHHDDPDLWSRLDDAGRAVHQCLRHCDVLGECAAWAMQRGGWTGVVVGGQRWSNQSSRPVHQPEQPCAACGASGCTECPQPIPASRGPQAKTCSHECSAARQKRQLRGHDRRRLAGRRQCTVCGSQLAHNHPIRMPTCRQESCVEAERLRSRDREVVAA